MHFRSWPQSCSLFFEEGGDAHCMEHGEAKRGRQRRSRSSEACSRLASVSNLRPTFPGASHLRGVRIRACRIRPPPSGRHCARGRSLCRASLLEVPHLLLPPLHQLLVVLGLRYPLPAVPTPRTNKLTGTGQGLARRAPRISGYRAGQPAKGARQSPAAARLQARKPDHRV